MAENVGKDIVVHKLLVCYMRLSCSQDVLFKCLLAFYFAVLVR